MAEIPENTPEAWRALFPFPDRDSHKYSRGTALIRGGAVMTGATRLAARAAQRVGAGLVTLAAPSASFPIYAQALESVIVRAVDEEDQWQKLIDDPHHPALLIGCGLGIGEGQARDVLAAVAAHRPTVLDADALTNFAGRGAELFAHTHDQCVMTPHEGEFARLFGGWLAGERADHVRAAARQAGCIVLLKGAETLIASPDGRMIANRNAPPWLATAGSGDVLAGMILGLFAQKMSLFEATAAAAWLHGRCGALHGAGLIAEDIVSTIPAALSEIAQ